MPIGTVDRGEVSEFEEEWVALIVPSSFVVQDPAEERVADTDSDEEPAEGNREERGDLHKCLLGWG